MRSTRASAALARLQERSANPHYAMARSADGLFSLLLAVGGASPEHLCEGLELDRFVEFVDGFGPQKSRRVTKSDRAFEAQLVKKPD